MRWKAAPEFLLFTLGSGHVYHVIEHELVSIPAIDESALAAFWAAVRPLRSVFFDESTT